MKGILSAKRWLISMALLLTWSSIPLLSPRMSAFANPPAFSGVHLDVQSMPKASPQYTNKQQAIFWVSGDASPGDTVLVSGAFTSTTKSVEIAVIPPGTADWKQVFRQPVMKAQIHSADVDSISFSIPDQLPRGVYAFRIVDESSVALYGRVNLPKVFWALGMNQQLTAGNVESGKALRIFGADFPDSATVFLVSGAKKASLSPRVHDGNSIEVDTPQSLAAGNYSMQVGSGAAPDSAASASVPLRISSPGSENLPPSKVVSCPGLGGSGGQDITASLQACLDSNVSPGNSVYFEIPPGSYSIKSSISLHPHQYLRGAGADKTTITGSSGTIPRAWITGSNYFGLSDLTIQAGMLGAIISSNDVLLTDESLMGDPRSTGHILLSGLHVIVSRLPSVTRATVGAVQVSGPDLRILNTVIDNALMNEDTSSQSNPNVGLNVVKGSGVVISGLQVKLGEKGEGISFESSQNVVLEHNAVDASSAHSFAAGTAIARGKSAPSENFYVASNTYLGFKGNTHEGITTDAGGGSFLGHVQSAAGAQLTLANDPDWSLTAGNTDGLLVSIIAGAGVGQYRFIHTVNGRSILVDRPWDLQPDQTSIVTITPYELHLVVTRNEVSDFQPGIQFYGMTFDSLIADNRLQDTAGIHLISLVYGTGTGLPIMNIQVTGNRISGRPDILADKGYSGIVVKNLGFSSFVSGVLVRNNQIDSQSVVSCEQTTVSQTRGILFDKNDAAFSKMTSNYYKANILSR